MKSTQQAAAIIKEWMETFTLRSMDSMHHHVKSAGISMPQFSLLMRMYHQGGCGMHEVSGHFDVSAAAASQMVDKLVHGGLVGRSENPDDRRAREITLTDQGTAFIEKGIEERYRWVSEMVAAMSPEECDAILASVPVLIAAEKRLPARPDHRKGPLQ
jgi:DNA-binding MarR family transcriptional regulator